jgi:hypothetical protein
MRQKSYEVRQNLYPPRYFYWEEARCLFELSVLSGHSASERVQILPIFGFSKTPSHLRKAAYGLVVGRKDRAFGDGSQQKQTQIEPGGQTC